MRLTRIETTRNVILDEKITNEGLKCNGTGKAGWWASTVTARRSKHGRIMRTEHDTDDKHCQTGAPRDKADNGVQNWSDLVCADHETGGLIRECIY